MTTPAEEPETVDTEPGQKVDNKVSKESFGDF